MTEDINLINCRFAQSTPYMCTKYALHEHKVCLLQAGSMPFIDNYQLD